MSYLTIYCHFFCWLITAASRMPQPPAGSHSFQQDTTAPSRMSQLPAGLHSSQQDATAPSRTPQLPAGRHSRQQDATAASRTPQLPAGHLSWKKILCRLMSGQLAINHRICVLQNFDLQQKHLLTKCVID